MPRWLAPIACLQNHISAQNGTPSWAVFHSIPCDMTGSSSSGAGDAQRATQAHRQQQSHVPRESEPGTAQADSARSEALARALSSQLTHPATRRIPSLTDLPAQLLSPDAVNLELDMSGVWDAGSDTSGMRNEGSCDRDKLQLHESAANPTYRAPQESESQRQRRYRPPLRLGGGIKIPAGGAPAGSRLAAMVGDSDYYFKADEEGREGGAGHALDTGAHTGDTP
jgi:hypothetical protein